MKIRNGFVSNSSSSSFIIAINKPTICPTCGGKSDDIRSKIKTSDYSYTKIIHAGVHEVLENLFKNKEWVENFNAVIEKITNLSSQGKEILKVEISLHDEELNNLIRSDAVEIIADNADYGW